MLKIIPFLNELAQHNHKSWFDENRNSYQEARAELLDFVENLLKQLSKANPWMLALKPNTCLFRINRDVRFSKNKNPYKTHAGIYMAPGGRNSGNAGFYIHIEPSKSFIGGGVYGPEPNVLKAIRREIYFNAAAFKQIVLNEGFQKTFGQLMDERLKRPPKGFPADFPDMEWLKYKHFVVSHSISNEDIGFDKLLNISVKVCGQMNPFIDFLNHAILNVEELLP
ncbi:MAG: DUF2461 domain-containing protein [Bacteroidales bacterium]|jgi:uncharacterized protein (TIGR02453 family)|nr:DUF2461 domain-containing protein [Bacteroidales bacterium]